MSSKKVSVYGLFSNETSLNHCVTRLKTAGFLNSDISCLMSDRGGNRDIGAEKNTKAPEGTATGTATGVLLGGALGWLAGIGALAIPGVGPLIAAGPIMAALAGAGIGAAVGGVSGALIGMGIPEYEAKRFEGLIKQGKMLISVHCDTSEAIDQAKQVLEECGAEDIASAKEGTVEKSDMAARGHDVTPRDAAYDRDRIATTHTDVIMDEPGQTRSVPPNYIPPVL